MLKINCCVLLRSSSCAVLLLCRVELWGCVINLVSRPRKNNGLKTTHNMIHICIISDQIIYQLIGCCPKIGVRIYNKQDDIYMHVDLLFVFVFEVFRCVNWHVVASFAWSFVSSFVEPNSPIVAATTTTYIYSYHTRKYDPRLPGAPLYRVRYIPATVPGVYVAKLCLLSILLPTVFSTRQSHIFYSATSTPSTHQAWYIPGTT